MRAFFSMLCLSGCTAGTTVLDRPDGGAAVDSGATNDSGSSSTAPGLRPGRAQIFIGDDVWTEDSFEVDVQRADGLIDVSLPVDSWRASAEIRHHRALVDIVAMINDATYCRDFPLCL